MKTIEERARDFVDAPCDRRCKKCKTLPADCRFYNDLMSFIAGAKSEQEELTRWHDPKRYPPDYHAVLVKIENADGNIKYAVGCNVYGRWQGSNVGNYDRIVGWRQILE